MVAPNIPDHEEPAWIATAKAAFERGIADWNRYFAEGHGDTMRVAWGALRDDIAKPHQYPQGLFDWRDKNYELILYQNARGEPHCMVLAQVAKWLTLSEPLYLPTADLSQLYNTLESVEHNVRIGLLPAPDREEIVILDVRGTYSLTPPCKPEDLAYLAESIATSVDLIFERLIRGKGIDHWGRWRN